MRIGNTEVKNSTLVMLGVLAVGGIVAFKVMNAKVSVGRRPIGTRPYIASFASPKPL